MRMERQPNAPIKLVRIGWASPYVVKFTDGDDEGWLEGEFYAKRVFFDLDEGEGGTLEEAFRHYDAIRKVMSEKGVDQFYMY